MGENRQISHAEQFQITYVGNQFSRLNITPHFLQCRLLTVTPFQRDYTQYEQRKKLTF